MKNYTDEKQFKADIRKYAENHHISGNEIGRLWQEVMLDDLLKRISLSEYKNNFILKGGLLLSAVVAINNRLTEDIDGEIKGLDLTENEIEKVFTSICNIKPDNGPLEITLSEIEKSQRMQGLWQRYEKKHPFAENITFDQIVSVAKNWINRLVSNE